MKSWTEHYWHTVPVMKMRIEEIVAHVNGKDKFVLEAGCNEGFLSAALIESGAKVVSLDNNPQVLEKALTMFPDLNVVQGDVCKLPFPDKYFDIAVGGEVLEHLPNPFVGLAELFRVAREKVVISVPVGSYWLGERSHIWEIAATSINHDSPVQTHMLKDILIITFIKRRNDDLSDIPPFDSARHYREEVEPEMNKKEG